MERLNHEFAPVFNESSQILILGTFPSVKSRENQFFYGHPRNRFWAVMAALTKKEVPGTIEEKKDLLLSGGIAIWDVIESCEIQGSSDSSIRNVVPADLNRIFNRAQIKAVYANGSKAYELYQKYSFERTGREIKKLPSTSPANAAYSLNKLIEIWKEEIVGGGFWLPPGKDRTWQSQT